MKDLKKSLKLLCFNNLSFCCSLKKECEDRDKCMKELGVSKEDFLKLKEEFDEKIKEISKK